MPDEEKSSKEKIDEFLKAGEDDPPELKEAKEKLEAMMSSIRSGLDAPAPTEDTLGLFVGMPSKSLEVPSEDEVARCLKIFGFSTDGLKVHAKELGKTVEDRAPENEGIMPSTIDFGEHVVHLSGTPMPVSEEIMASTWQVAHIDQDLKKPFLAHQSNFCLTYRGKSEDPKVIYKALFAVAGAFLELGCLGILNPVARNFLPRQILLSNAITTDFAQAIDAGEFPPYTLTNFISMFDPEGGTWVCSRGHHVFDVPDFVMFMPEGANLQGAHQIIAHLFDEQLAGRANYKLGDKVKLGRLQAYLCSSDDDLFKYQLAGPGETFMMQISEADQQAGPSRPGGKAVADEQKKGCAAGSMLLIGLAVIAILLR